MKTLVFIGSNKSGSSREAIKAAEQLGYYTVLLTDNGKFIKQRLEFPDVHEMILTKLNDYKNLKENIIHLQKQGNEVIGIISFLDAYVEVAAILSNEFKLGCFSPEPMRIMNDKIQTREYLNDLSTTPYFTKYYTDQNIDGYIQSKAHPYPLVVKSPFSNGSKDVLLVKNKEEMRKAITKLSSNKKLLIEEYLDGPQYLVEVLVHDSQVHIVAIIEQDITLFQRFIVTGYNVLAEVKDEIYNSLYKSISTIIKRVNLVNGACHLEMRYVNNVWKLIEINPRISGGAMNRMIECAFGINLVKETIKLYLGKKPDLKKKKNKFVYTHYLTVDRTGLLVKVTGKNRCSNHAGVEEVYIKPRKGSLIQPPKSMGHRYGYVIASSHSKKEAKKIACDASKEIRFYLEPM